RHEQPQPADLVRHTVVAAGNGGHAGWKRPHGGWPQSASGAGAIGKARLSEELSMNETELLVGMVVDVRSTEREFLNERGVIEAYEPDKPEPYWVRLGGRSTGFRFRRDELALPAARDSADSFPVSVAVWNGLIQRLASLEIRMPSVEWREETEFS